MKFAEIPVRQPVFALMLVLGLVVLGLVSLSRLDVALNPDVDYPFVAVSTVLAGAAPRTIENDVTDVLEEEINTTEGIRTLRSSSTEGLSRIFVEFDLGYDVNVKAQQIREKVALARPRLPLDTEDPVVTQLDPDAEPVMTVLLAGPLSIRELSEFAEHGVAERLERLPGVGSVNVIGSRRREVRIWLDPLRLTGYGLTVDDVISALRRENAEVGGGQVVGAEREWNVTIDGKLAGLEDFSRLPIPVEGGREVHLRDVARLSDGLAEERSIARLNGQRGVSLEIRRQSGMNTVAVAQAVRSELEAIRRDLPAGMQVVLARDGAEYIESSIEGIFLDMLYGGFLAVAVVLLFLRNSRSTFIASLAIPSSIIAAFTFFYLAGFTLNSMTLMALSLSIGLVIDDAIVVLEAVWRRMERGLSAREAAVEGPTEVGLAVVSTTLAVCAVFVPIAFMEGMVGQWFFEFGLVVAIAVCVSTLVALTLTPMTASLLLRPNRRLGAVFALLERGFGALERVYQRLLGSALRHKAVTLGLAAAAVVAGIGIASTLPFDFYQTGDRSEFLIHAKLPIGTPLHVTDRTTRKMEARLHAQPEVRDVFSSIGSVTERAPHRATIFVQLVPIEERAATQTDIMARLRDELIAEIPEAEEISVSEISFASSSDRAGELQYTLRGPELETLSAYSAQLVDRMRDDPDFVDVSSSFESGKPEIQLEIDRDVSADLGVSAVLIGRTVRSLVAGEKVGSFEQGGERYDVRVRVLPQYRDDPGRLSLIHVRSLRGDLVPLPNVAHVRLGSGPVEIQRENRARQITLYANLAGDLPLGLGTAKLEGFGRELGIEAPNELAPTGRVRAMKETGVAIGFAFLLALGAIYMILASLFNSLVHPFTIMMSAPLSFIGGFLALSLAGMSLDLMSGIGLLVLMGLVMKNGILLVDYANQLRETGASAEEAMLEAGPVRMRPVLMTTGALVFGLLPVAVGAGIGTEFRAPLGVITIGGLLTSTLLTLVVVPVVYTVIDRLDGTVLAARLRALLPRLRRSPALEPIRAVVDGNYDPEGRYPAATVNITNQCSLQCEHCVALCDGNPNHAPESIRDQMDEDTMLETLAKLRDRHGIDSMMWMGGEPLLRKSLLVRGIELFPRNTITTNGTLPLLDLGPEVLYVVSLDGPEDVSDAIRGAGAFKQVLRNLEQLPVDFSSPVQVQCVVTRRNQDRLEELVRALEKTRVDWMTFSFHVPRIGEVSENAWRDNEERAQAVYEVLRLKSHYPAFIRNSRRSLHLMLPEHAARITADCPVRHAILPLHLEGDRLVTAECAYGSQADCERCGAWAAFQLAAQQSPERDVPLPSGDRSRVAASAWPEPRQS